MNNEEIFALVLVGIAAFIAGSHWQAVRIQGATQKPGPAQLDAATQWLLSGGWAPAA